MFAQMRLDGSDWLFKGYLGDDWELRGAQKPDTRDRRGWTQARVPGSVHNDLWLSGLIPNPYFERNSLLSEWVSQRTWVYKKAFAVPEVYYGRRIRLRFEGVDYEAQFFLNGEKLGEHSGMFTPVEFDVSGRLKFGEDNLLAVVIQPAPYEQPQVGRTSRVRTHKSRMTYWWDFCPRLVHQGIWDGVTLEISGPVYVEEIFVQPRLSEDFQNARVSISAELSSTGGAPVEVETAIYYREQEVARGHGAHAAGPQGSHIEIVLDIEKPRLWWPNGHGEQPLYRLEMKALQAASGEGDSPVTVSHLRDVAFGIRRISFERNETADESARPYTLVVNGRRIYIKGWNWVPLDVMYGVERPEKLERLLKLAQNAQVNLLRVWGGGLIEKSAFYDLCDRLGILVWQEFIQSSSGLDNIPSSDPHFVGFMAEQARKIVPRRRNHPSLALWCGGNELQAGPERPLDDTHPVLAALKAVVEELDPGRYWLPTSPSGRLFSFSLANVEKDALGMHDVHGPWEHQGLDRHQALYDGGRSLLHSEFGVEGITHLRTLNATISQENQLPVSLDNPAWQHLGAWWVKEERWREIFGDLESIEAHVRATQFLQADGLRYAVEASRRRKYENSGMLPWQFNEPYPMAACTSAVDYYGEPKPVYYAVARAYRSLQISARFTRQAWSGDGPFRAEIWAANSGLVAYTGAPLDARIAGASGKLYSAFQEHVPVESNVPTRLASIEWDIEEVTEPVFFLDLSLADASGALLAENRYIFTRGENLAPLLNRPLTELSAALDGAGDTSRLRVANTGRTAALYVWLQEGRDPRTEGPSAFGRVFFSDNYFCLFPNESREITVGWAGAPPGVRKLEAGAWNARVLEVVQQKGERS